MTANVTARINARLSGPLAEHFEHMCGKGGPYASAADYIRNLVRRDMEQGLAPADAAHRAFETPILETWPDLTTDISFAATADFVPDLLLLG